MFMRGQSIRIKWKKAKLPLHIFFVVLCILFVYPVALTIIVSFTENKEIVYNGYSLFPEKWSLEGYSYALKNHGIANAYKISILTSVAGMVLSVLILFLYAYPLSRKDFKKRTAFTYFAYFSTYLSGGLVPWYIMCTQVYGLKNNLWALFVPHLMTPSYIIILRTFITNNVPMEMIEAAKIDGASEYRIVWQLVFSLAKPGIATIALFKLLSFWNDYYLPMMLVTDNELYNLQYYLQIMFTNVQRMADDILTDLPGMQLAELPTETIRMAMCVITMGPILVIYPFFQKYFVKGLTVGSVKG